MINRASLAGRSALIAVAMAAVIPGVPALSQDPRAYSDPADHRCFQSQPSGRIVILSQYGGKGPAVSYKIPGSNDINRVTTVTGSGRDPIVLVLLGFDSQIWDVSKVGKGRIRAIYASGMYPQGVSGAEKGVPIVFSDTHGKGRTTVGYCPTMQYAGDGKEIVEAAQTIRQIFRRGPSDLHESYSTPTFNVDGGPLTDMPLTPPARAVRAGVPIDVDGMPNGEPGLRWMVERGILRPADRGDVERWKAMGGTLEPYRQQDAMMMGPGGQAVMHGPAYVATRNIDHIPEGLVSAAMTTFIIPEGVRYDAKENTHGAVLRLRGIKGIPPTSAPQPRVAFSRGGELASSFDTYALLPLAPGYQPHHVRWNAAGEVIDETPAINDNDNTHNGSGHQSVRDFLAGRIKPGPFDDMPMGPGPEVIVPPRSTPTPETAFPVPGEQSNPSRDMTPTALIAALLFSLGAAGLVLNRRRTGQPSYPFGGNDGITQAQSPAVLPPRDTGEHEPTETRAPDGIARLSASLQEAIDLARDDATALALVKFKRTVMRAMREPEYDEDIADELDAIVERHMAETTAVYVRAAKRTTGSRSDALEANLRQAVTRLTGRVDELAQEQSRRDADRLRQRSDFIRARHPDSGDIGDGA